MRVAFLVVVTVLFLTTLTVAQPQHDHVLYAHPPDNAADAHFTTMNNNSDISFTDVTTDYKAEGYSDSGYGHGLSFADVNQDDRIDLFVSNAVREQRLPDLLYINKNSWFSEEAKNRGTYDAGLTHSIVSADIDNDGDLDGFFANMSVYPDQNDGFGRNALYQNDGNGYYTDISDRGISTDKNDTRGAIALDINNDGWLDLYGVNWGQRNEMYLNQGNGWMQAVDRGANGPSGDTSAKQGVTAADFDNDGDIDIYTSRRETDNWFFVNDGAGNFTEQADELNVDVGGRTNGATFADIDNDADLDLFVVNSSLSGGSTPYLYVFINNGDGTFEERTDDFNIRVSGYSVSFGDVDNDADLDMFLLHNDEKTPGARPTLFLNDGAGQFERIRCGVEVPANDARAVAYADIDNDGDIDFYLTAKFGQNYLLRNDLESDNNYIDILCFGPSGDYGGFGSKVIVYEPGYLGSPNHILGYQESVSNYAYLCQNQTALHFGLANYSFCDIRIIRTNGQTFDYQHVEANQFFNMNDHEPGEFNLYYESGDDQVGEANQPLEEPFVVSLVNQSGDGVAGAEVTFTPQNGGHMLEAQPVLTDDNGYASAYFVPGAESGRYEVTAVSNYTGDATVVFHAQATERTVHIAKNYGDNQTGTVGQPLCSPVVVIATFEDGDVAEDIDIKFSVPHGSGDIMGEPTLTTSTDAEGKARAVWTLGEHSGEHVLFARYQEQELRFSATASPDSAVKIVAEAITGEAFHVGTTYPASCQAFDVYENAVPDQDVFFRVLSGNGSMDGEKEKSVKSDARGCASVEWTIGLNHTYQNVLRASIEDDSARFEINEIVPPLLTFSSISAGDSIFADGSDSTIIKVELKNEKNWALPDYAVDIQVNGAENQLIPLSEHTNDQGVFSAILQSTVAENKRITAAVPGVGVVPDTATVLFLSPPPQGVHLVHVSGDSQRVIVGHNIDPLIARVVDETNRPLTGYGVVFRASNDQVHFGESDSVIVENDENGYASITPGIKPQIKYNHVTVSARLRGESSGIAFQLNVLPGVPASLSRLSPDSLTVNPGDSINIAVRARDAFGNDTPGATVIFSLAQKDDFLVCRADTTDSNGLATSTVIAGRTPGRRRVDAAVNDSIKAFFSFNVRPIQEHLVKMTPDTIVLSNDNNLALLIVKCFDPFEKPLADVPVHFISRMGKGEFVQPSLQRSNRDGLATTTWRVDSQESAAIISAISPHDSVRFYIRLDAGSLGVAGRDVPTDFVLGDNYPNPFNPTTRIPFSLPRATCMTLEIYNINGQVVRTLVDGLTAAGQHVLVFDALDNACRPLPSGLYFSRMIAEDFVAKKRLLLLK